MCIVLHTLFFARFMDLIIRKITFEFVEIIPKSSSIFFHKTFLNPLKSSLLSLLNRLYYL
jgi:hypothetical protein